MKFNVPAELRVKLKENKMKDKFLDLTRELKKMWNNKVTVIPNLSGALGTVTNGLIQGLEDEWRSSTLLHYWDRPEYSEVSWRLEETCCPSNYSGKTIN